jgi:hypothetical protein
MHVTIDDAPFMEEQKRQISELDFTRMCGAKIHCLPHPRVTHPQKNLRAGAQFTRYCWVPFDDPELRLGSETRVSGPILSRENTRSGLAPILIS